MTTGAATRCWGLAIAVTILLASGCTTPRTPKPAPTLATYALAWHVALGVAPPAGITDDTSMAFVSTGDAVVAFTLATGERAWRNADVAPGGQLVVAGDLLLMLAQGLEAHEDRVAIPARVLALDRASGRRLWQHDLVVAPIIGPVLATDEVTVAAGRELWSFRLRDGTETRHVTLEDTIAQIAADGRRILAALATPALVAVDLGTRAVAWQMPIDAAATSLVMNDDRVLVTGADETLTTYHADRRAPLIWRVERVAVVGAPVVANQRIYVARYDNTLRAYNAGNGTEVWRVRLGSRPRPDLRLIGQELFVAMLNGAIATCLARTGDPSAEIPLGLPGDAATPEWRLEISAMTPDGASILRVIRPSTFPTYTVVASRRQDAAARTRESPRTSAPR